MNSIHKYPLDRLGYDFLPAEFIPQGRDEYYIRNQQQPIHRRYRGLRAHEIEILIKNENRSDDWGRIFVTDKFNPELVNSCHFFGMVRIGDLEPRYLEQHDLRLPVGLYDSTIVSCDIGSNVAIRNVHYLAHYIIGDDVMLLNVMEMHTSNHAKFGNGIVKEGEEEKVRIWIEVWNELEGRAILPFNGIRPADAWMWAKYRDDLPLLDHFREMTDARYDHRRGYYGTIGPCSVIKHCGVIKDVAVGSHAYIKGANKLKNLTINSDEQESTQIGEGCELVNGIIGHGCRIFYGVMAVRFVMGTKSNLKYGARLINSYLGDNSTVSCCEMLHNLIFPSHEQHHNNSFLIASCLKGQSNIAAGATIGSNHNSRANDGEIIAGRGFWPGLCSSLKHNCRFASFILLAKGAYPAELDIPLPFSLVSNDESRDCLTVMPAYWFLYNAYALVRNAWKFQARDSRVHREQKMEFDYLAPDSVEEIFSALELLEEWTAKAHLRSQGVTPDPTLRDELLATGRDLITNSPKEVAALEILGERMEHSRRKVIIQKVEPAYLIFKEMLNYYAVKNLIPLIFKSRTGVPPVPQSSGSSQNAQFNSEKDEPITSLEEFKKRFTPKREKEWTNLGGQLVLNHDLASLKAHIVSRELKTWDDVHDEYDRLWAKYPHDKAAHAYATLLDANGLTPETLDAARWTDCLDRAKATQDKIVSLTRDSRAKDYENPFKRMSFDNQEEMDAVMGRLEDNGFVKQIVDEAEEFGLMVEKVKNSITNK